MGLVARKPGTKLACPRLCLCCHRTARRRVRSLWKGLDLGLSCARQAGKRLSRLSLTSAVVVVSCSMCLDHGAACMVQAIPNLDVTCYRAMALIAYASPHKQRRMHPHSPTI